MTSRLAKMSIIIDLNAVCFVCLQDTGVMRSVFEKDELTPELTILEKIFQCSEMKLEIRDNELPDKICTQCLGDLASAWRFRNNCETAYSVFLTIIQQHQTEDESTKPDFECTLQQRQLKLPPGLRIKRLESETKAILLPVHANETEDEEVEEEARSVHEEQQTQDDEASEITESLDIIVEKRAENFQYDDEEYYEAEEVLNEEDSAEEQLEEVNQEAEQNIPNKNKECGEANELNNLNQNIEIKQEWNSSWDDTSKANVKPPEQTIKRGRGRPKLGVKNSKKCSVPANKKRNNSTRMIKNEFTNKKWNCDVDMQASRPSKICELCGNIYKYQHALNAHMRRHLNDRQFSCEFCNKAFVSGVELRRHMRVHTGQKPYGCKYCDRNFSDFGSRVKHERTHTGERPYSCSTCNKSFAYAHVLSVHLRTHTGEKKFQCTRCPKGFTKKAYLQAHLENHDRSVALSNLKYDDVNECVQQNDLTVAVEECIFTTDYIIETETKIEETEEAAEETGLQETYELVDNDDVMTEEHLEEHEDTKFILGV